MHQQAPEIGLLQALGLGRGQLYRVYVYEITAMVFIAGVLGGAIGSGMSWLIGAPPHTRSRTPTHTQHTHTLCADARAVAQQQVMQEQPVAFSLPVAEFASLSVSSVLMACVAVLGPVRGMLGRPIVSLMKG